MKPRNDTAWILQFAAAMLALCSSLAVLFIGEIVGQAPCNLCWFQRAFMFPLAIILPIATYRSDAGVWVYGLPLAIAGSLIAAFHTLVYFGLISEAIRPCTATGPSCSGADMAVAGAPLPLLSLLTFAVIATCLALSKWKKP